MARPHIEFIQSQHLLWSTDLFQEIRPGVLVKLLSQDPVTRDVSAIVRYPPGWHRAPERLAVAEEIFVLDGCIEFGSEHLTRDCYAYWPGGTARPAISTKKGADVLTFIQGGTIRPIEGAADPGPDEQVLCINVREGEWIADVEAMGLSGMAASARIRTLRNNKAKGEITYISAAIPYWRESQPERHPVVQEIFVLSGEVAGNTGLMKTGAYVWRPENIEHGPYGSLTGAVMLFRSMGGAFSTELSDPVEFTFSPCHCPTVPEFLRSAATQVSENSDRY